jgi:hypothetical protein
MYLIHEYGLVAVAAIIGLECLCQVPGEPRFLLQRFMRGPKAISTLTP